LAETEDSHLPLRRPLSHRPEICPQPGPYWGKRIAMAFGGLLGAALQSDVVCPKRSRCRRRLHRLPGLRRCRSQFALSAGHREHRRRFS